MTLKIEKYTDGDSTTIRLIGRMRAEHLEELEKQIRESGPALILDLDFGTREKLPTSASQTGPREFELNVGSRG